MVQKRTPLRVGLITPGFSACESDWCIPALLNLVRLLAKHHDVHVFTLRYPHRRENYPVYGATIHAFGGGVAGGTARLPLLARALAAVLLEHRRRAFDVLHAVWADESGFLATTAGRLTGAPAVVSVYGGELVGLPDIEYGVQLSRVGRWFVRTSLQSGAQVTVGSSYLRQRARDVVDQDRLRLMPVGVDTNLFHAGSGNDTPTPLPDGDTKLLHVASLVPVKDQTTLLQALALIVGQAAGVHLHVVGGGPLLNHLRQLAQSLGIDGHVTFHGAVTHDHLPAYFRAADLCVLSSRYESQGMVTLEAAACERTTVGTAVGLLPEVVPQTQVVPVGNAEALAQAVLTALEDRERLAASHQAALAAVQTRYTLKHTVAQLNHLYSELSGC